MSRGFCFLSVQSSELCTFHRPYQDTTTCTRARLEYRQCEKPRKACLALIKYCANPDQKEKTKGNQAGQFFHILLTARAAPAPYASSKPIGMHQNRYWYGATTVHPPHFLLLLPRVAALVREVGWQWAFKGRMRVLEGAGRRQGKGAACLFQGSPRVLREG